MQMKGRKVESILKAGLEIPVPASQKCMTNIFKGGNGKNWFLNDSYYKVNGMKAACKYLI